MKTNKNPPEIPRRPHTRMLPSSSQWDLTPIHKPLTPVQEYVVNALAAGITLSKAAETYGLHRVTVFRWMKTSKLFTEALRRARAEFVLARRDDLFQLSNRALETLMSILNNPRSSPAVLLRTSMFILQRPQLPKTGWSMPEPAPDPDGNKLLDSAIIEQDYDGLPGLCNIEKDPENEAEEPAVAAESTTSEPESPAAEAPECNEMQHENEICDDVAWPRRPYRDALLPGAASRPGSPPKARKLPEVIDLLKTVQEFTKKSPNDH